MLPGESGETYTAVSTQARWVRPAEEGHRCVRESDSAGGGMPDSASNNNINLSVHNNNNDNISNSNRQLTSLPVTHLNKIWYCMTSLLQLLLRNIIQSLVLLLLSVHY